MISKIIQKEKERQDDYLKYLETPKIEEDTGHIICPACGDHYSCDSYFQEHLEEHNKGESHKQSLINLKEYMEGEYIFLGAEEHPDHSVLQDWVIPRVKQLQEDIKELIKMIEAYDA